MQYDILIPYLLDVTYISHFLNINYNSLITTRYIRKTICLMIIIIIIIICLIPTDSAYGT